MQTARIKLVGRNPSTLDNVCNDIKEISNKLGVSISGPIPLPTKNLRVPVIRTPCGDGMHRGGGGGNWETWETRIHKRIINLGASDRVLRQITRLNIPKDVTIEMEITN